MIATSTTVDASTHTVGRSESLAVAQPGASETKSPFKAVWQSLQPEQGAGEHSSAAGLPGQPRAAVAQEAKNAAPASTSAKAPLSASVRLHASTADPSPPANGGTVDAKEDPPDPQCEPAEAPAVENELALEPLRGMVGTDTTAAAGEKARLTAPSAVGGTADYTAQSRKNEKKGHFAARTVAEDPPRTDAANTTGFGTGEAQGRLLEEAQSVLVPLRDANTATALVPAVPSPTAPTSLLSCGKDRLAPAKPYAEASQQASKGVDIPATDGAEVAAGPSAKEAPQVGQTVAHQSVDSAATHLHGDLEAGASVATIGSPSPSAGPLAGGHQAKTVPMSMQSARTAAYSSDLRIEHYDGASANRLEVGLSDGSSGWLRVRAELTSDGNVRAVLRGSSETMENGLRSQMTELTNYLSVEQVPVHRVEIETSVESASPWSGAAGTGGGDANRQGSREGNASDATGQMPRGTRPVRSTAEEQVQAAAPAGSMARGASAGYTAGSGTWLSIRV